MQLHALLKWYLKHLLDFRRIYVAKSLFILETVRCALAGAIDRTSCQDKNSIAGIISFTPLHYYAERANDVIRRVFVFCGHIGEA